MSYGQAVKDLITMFLVMLAVSVPLAIWKLVDISIWLWGHVGISWK